MTTEKAWDVPGTARFVFHQEGDSAGGPDTQTLTLEVDDAGGGCFVLLSTERWALNPDDIDRFAAMLKRHVALCRGFFGESSSESQA